MIHDDKAIVSIERAIAHYVQSLGRNVSHTAGATGDDELAKVEAIWKQTEKSYGDLLDARDTLWDGGRIAAVDLHTFAVLKALGLRRKECRAVWLYYCLGSSAPRSPAAVAAELGVEERSLEALITAITAKVPQLRFPKPPYSPTR